MRNQGSFSIEFKRQVVEELLSGESRPAQLCRRHNISASLLYHWKEQYSRGKFNNEPTEEAAFKDMVISRLNQGWIADITYIRIQTGFVYLAAILDACSRRAIGYAISANIDTR